MPLLRAMRDWQTSKLASSTRVRLGTSICTATGCNMASNAFSRPAFSAPWTAKVDQSERSIITSGPGLPRNARICSKQPLRKNIADENHSASRIIRVLNESENQALSVPRQERAPSRRESRAQRVVLPTPLAPSREITSGRAPCRCANRGRRNGASARRCRSRSAAMESGSRIIISAPPQPASSGNDRFGGPEHVHRVAGQRRGINVLRARSRLVAVDVTGRLQRGARVFEQLP